MKHFIILQAVKNRRKNFLFVDLSRKLFGKEMMLLPRWEAFLLIYPTFLRMDILEIQPLCMNGNADIVLCWFFAELHVTRSCLLHKFPSRPSHLECCPRVSRL